MKALLLLIPVIGGITGWVIVSGVLKLLFWPRRPTKILNISLCGLLPQKQADLAAGVRQMVETGIKSAVTAESGMAPELLDNLIEMVVTAAREHLEGRIPALVPGGIRRKITAIVEDIIRREIPVFVHTFGGQVQQGGSSGSDLCCLVEEGIKQYDLSELERKLFSSREILWIKIAAAAVGLFSGLLQLLVAILFTA